MMLNLLYDRLCCAAFTKVLYRKALAYVTDRHTNLDERRGNNEHHSVIITAQLSLLSSSVAVLCNSHLQAS